MKIEEVLPEARKRRKIKRAGWACFIEAEVALGGIAPSDLLADDWEVEPETQKFPLDHGGGYFVIESENVRIDMVRSVDAVYLTRSDVKCMKIAIDKAQGVKPSVRVPEYVEPTYERTEKLHQIFYECDEDSIESFRPVHRACWDEFVKRLTEGAE